MTHHPTSPADPPRPRQPRRVAGVVLGLGLGGFADGITLHQIAQWHNMGSAKLPPVTLEAMKQNMLWDGAFHAATWVLTVAGVYLLLRAARRGEPLPTPRGLSWQIVLGWGIFNFVEGLVDHHLLDLHHVRDMPVHVPLYDWIFLLGAGLGFIALGWVLSRERDAAHERPV